VQPITFVLFYDSQETAAAIVGHSLMSTMSFWKRLGWIVCCSSRRTLWTLSLNTERKRFKCLRKSCAKF